MKKVIMYGAGGNLGASIELVKGRNLVPIAVTDTYLRTTGNIMGLPFVEKEQILSLLEDEEACVYITPLGLIKFEIQSILVKEIGVCENKIENFDSSYSCTRCISCSDLRKVAIIGSKKRLFLCCKLGGDLRNQSPMLKMHDDNYLEIAEDFQKQKESLINKLQRGEKCICSGCNNLSERFWDDKVEKIQTLAISTGDKCQLSCIYCEVFSNARNIVDHREECAPEYEFNVIEMVKAMECKNMLDLKEPIQLSAGEITINPNKKEILDYLKKYPLQIFTNAIIYDEQVAELTARTDSFLNISIDAGTEDTYLAVKGMNKYEQVKSNIRKYKAKESNMELKYILLVENCMKEDIDGFLDFCAEIRPQVVNISTDQHYDHNNLNPIIIEMAGYMTKKLEKENLSFRILSTFTEQNVKDIEMIRGK